MTTPFDGLNMHLGNIARLSGAVTRSISPENPTGAPGQGGRQAEVPPGHPARELGQGWKVSPNITVGANAAATLADIEGPGTIQHIWLTVGQSWWRSLVFRCYWDGEESPSVEVPLGDFFANGWCEPANLSSLAICVNPKGGFNSYWPMPFRQRARITVENLTGQDCPGLYYQITYALGQVPDDAAYLHAQWRRSNPLPYMAVHTLLDGVQGQGQYAGTYLAWGVNNNNWWGEGEIKFYLDSDQDFPTLCGTGTEDYFGGAWNFEWPPGAYGIYSTPYSGLHQVIKPDGLYRAQQRFGLYRWHIMDPVRFRQALRVTIQALGWRSEGRFLPLQDDIASTAFWYQAEPHAAFPTLPGRDALEVI